MQNQNAKFSYRKSIKSIKSNLYNDNVYIKDMFNTKCLISFKYKLLKQFIFNFSCAKILKTIIFCYFLIFITYLYKPNIQIYEISNKIFLLIDLFLLYFLHFLDNLDVGTIDMMVM